MNWSDRLIEDYRLFALRRARDFRDRLRLPRAGVEAGELDSAALLGLVRAARTYAPRPGASFAAYADAVIRGEMLMELRRLRPAGFRRGRRWRYARPLQLSLPDLEDGRPIHARDGPVGWEIESIDAVEALAARLPEKEGHVIKYLFIYCGLDTDRAVGGHLGVGRSRAQQLRAVALSRLKQIMADGEFAP